MRPLMVQGCTSSAGKSLLTTVLCRWASDQGIDVAQWLQARAARIEPHVDHNPVLVKPEADTRSQVVVHGRVDEQLTGMPWLERPPQLWDAIKASVERRSPRWCGRAGPRTSPAPTSWCCSAPASRTRRVSRADGHGHAEALTDGLGLVADNVLGTTAHGLLEDPAVVAVLLGTPPPPSLDDVLDELTAAVVPHLDTDLILTTIGA